MATPVRSFEITRWESGEMAHRPDLLAVEEPMEIRLGYGPEHDRQQKSLSVTMRTPGHDFDLSLGFLFTEGIIDGIDQVLSLDYCGNVKRPEEAENVVKVELKADVKLDFEKLERHFYTTSSCGVCGKASIEALDSLDCAPFAAGAPQVPASLLARLPDLAREQQAVFRHTGGLHAATLFDLEGKVLIQREDIGRHNAVDKVVGHMLQAGRLPLSEVILLVSGRAGFELVQKAIRAGIPIMGAVGAPSSLAAELGRDYGLTLAGFLRSDRMNIYSGADRIEAEGK